jgi:acyl carrier protein
MTDIRAVVLQTLSNIAPEIDPDALDAARPLREQVDLDSMDWLNFLIALHANLRVDIPEADYQKLRSLNDLVSYLAGKGAGGK